MPNCIYCPEQFDEAPREHVINAFLGARWKDGNLICPSCQTEFADGIDKTFADQLQPYRLFLGTKGDHGGTGSEIRNVKVTSGETINIGIWGQPSLARPQVRIIEHENQKQVQLKVRCQDDLGWALSEVRKQVPGATINEEEVKRLGDEQTDRIDGEFAIDFSLGGAGLFRGMIKCCANLFAAHAPDSREAFLTPAFDAVRAFVYDGTGAMTDFARWTVSVTALELPKLGPADQAIALTTRNGGIEGVMQFFGHLPFAVRLTTNYDGPEVRCAYVVDPYREAEPAERRLSGEELTRFDDHLPVFAEQSRTRDCTAWHVAFERFIGHYTERENEKIIQQVIEQTIEENPRAAEVPREQLESMARKLIKKRFDRFEQTGDASGITIFKTRS